MSGYSEWRGKVTAVSSIVHGDQSLGTVTYLRRERFLLPDGSTDDIPVVSGNAWRGVLRRVAADLWWEAAGEPPLTLAVTHAIWAGGALAKSTGKPLTGSRLMEVKKACPVIGVFGASGGGRIVEGCLRVGKMLPICRELSHVLPPEYSEIELPSLWDLSQIENYSKVVSSPRDDVVQHSADDENNQPMRFGVETFIAGTVFHTWVALEWPTPAESAFFSEVIAAYARNPRVGGMAKTGHGNLSFDSSLVEAFPVNDSAYNWREDVAGFASLQKILAALD